MTEGARMTDWPFVLRSYGFDTACSAGMTISKAPGHFPTNAMPEFADYFHGDDGSGHRLTVPSPGRAAAG